MVPFLFDTLGNKNISYILLYQINWIEKNWGQRHSNTCRQNVYFVLLLLNEVILCNRFTLLDTPSVLVTNNQRRHQTLDAKNFYATILNIFNDLRHKIPQPTSLRPEKQRNLLRLYSLN